MNNSDKYIVDIFFDTIKQTKDNDPYLYKIFSNEYVDEFYIDLYNKYKFDFISKIDLKNALKKNVIKIYGIIIKRKDIFDKIITKKIKLIDLTETRKLIDILKYDSQKTIPRKLFLQPKTSKEILKEKLFISDKLFHPSQLEKKYGKVKTEEKKEKEEEKLKKVQSNLSVLFGDKKKPEEIEKIAEKLIEQQPEKVKYINIKLVEDLIKEEPKKEVKVKKLKCKDGKIINKFTNKCINEESPIGIFMKSKNAKLDEVTKEDLDNYINLKLEDLKKICKTNAPNISCEQMYTKKELYYHIFNNINIHNNKLLCEDNKVYYHDVKKCIDKRESTTKIKKSKGQTKEKKDNVKEISKSPPKSYKTVSDKIKQQIKENLKKKNPIPCKENEVYNKFTDRCVKDGTMTSSFLLSNYGNLNNITKNDLKKITKMKRDDLDKLCKKFPHIGCNFNTKEELLRHILDNIKIDKNELFCEDNKVYYHDVKKCTDRRLTKTEKEKLKEKETKIELNEYRTDNNIYKKYAKLLIKNAYEHGFIQEYNYENTNKLALELIKTIHKDILNKLETYLKNNEILKKVESSKDYYENLINKVYETYYNNYLKTDTKMKKYIKKNIFVDITDNMVDLIYEFNIREIILKLLFESELSTNKILNLNFSYKLLPKSLKPQNIKKIKKSPKVVPMSPDLKKLENIQTIEDIVSYMISKGNKDKLLGNKIKKQTTVNYIIKLLENMRKSFYKMLDKDNTVLTTDNRKFFIDKFITENINDKIDDISNNLISCCLSSMNLDNSRKWFNKYLPIVFNKIV